jgi:hypothetical protein
MAVRRKHAARVYRGRKRRQAHAVYAALKDYLNASDRMDILGAERPLWTWPDRSGRAGAPLRSRSFVENLKKYGRAAGLGEIHHH